MSDAASGKYARLVELIREHTGVLVAYSGGVDSTLLLVAAREALGPRAVAALGCSPLQPAGELTAARALAEELGVRLLTVECDVLADPAIRANPPERCYLCKRTLLLKLQSLATAEGLTAVLEGSNADDLQDWRPGRRAVEELGVRSPLLEVGLTKAEIRALARTRALAVWDKPALACLATRVPYGSPLSAERLQRIDRAEEAVRALGLRHVRVRDHGALARIEVDPAMLPALVTAEARSTLVAALKALGYCYVALDLEGYRLGALNEGPLRLHHTPLQR